MFGLFHLNKYLMLLILACFGLSGAVLGEEGDLNSISGLFDIGVQGGPVFVKEPEDRYYVVKSKPSVLECIAQGAVHISFKCAGSWIKQHHHTNNLFIDPVTQKETLHSSIFVSREDVEDYYGSDGYWCECYASDHKSETPGANIVKSKRGFVELAYLKRRFEREPVAVRVELEQQTLLSCLPPDGKPLPKVFWLKDGQEIDVKGDINFIISSEGSLIINQARLIDTGNYTCGAQNIVARRLSHTAPLTVYVNGGWSIWSLWSACSVSCGKGLQRRQRTCTNPTPRGGGKECDGEAIQRTSCNFVCPVDGLWSSWSSWSTCNTDCVHHRRRACDHPSPTNGGKYCVGTDLDTVNCTTGMCQEVKSFEPVMKSIPLSSDQKGHARKPEGRKDLKTGNIFPSDGELSRQGIATETHEAKSTENLTMYIGLCVATTMFIVVIIIVIVIVKRRNGQQQNNTNHLRNGGPGNHSQPFDEKKFKNGNLLTMQPDLTQISTVQTPSTDFSSNNHPTIYHELPAYAEVNDLRHNNPAVGSAVNNIMVVEPNLTHLDNNAIHEMPLINDRNTAYNTVIVSPMIPHLGATDGLEVDETDNLRDSKNSLMSNELPGHIDTDAVTWNTFDHRGGKLTLPESGVCLLIPEGAIKQGQKEEMYMAVCRDDKDRPKLSDNQTILSPVVLCGPTDILLQKPVILSIQHCASMRQGGWKLSVCSSHTPLEQPPQWQLSVTLGQENINTQVYAQLDSTHCHIMTEQLQRYTLIGEPALLGRAIKILRLAAFAPALPPSMDYSIRVYVVEDTPDALEGVMQMERRLGGQLLDKPKQIAFQDGGQNLCLTIEELASGWRSKLAANYQEIPFRHIWSGNQNNLHCSFSLEMVDRVQERISCLIQVYQKAILSNRQVLKINRNFKQPPTCSTPVSSTVKGRPSTVTTNSSSGVSSVVSHDDTNQVSRLPSHVRHQLCALLDTPCARGNDWRMLAQALTVDRYINYFATKTSPTEHILNLWEAIYREETAVTDLMNILRVMGRMDAAAMLEKDTGVWL